MFFHSKTVDALVEDHKALKQETPVIRNMQLSHQVRSEAFERLAPKLKLHDTKEEGAIHAYMKSSSNKELALMAQEGEEEHHIAAQLIQELQSKLLTTDEWSAKSRVLSKLVDHHIDEEEHSVFPMLKKSLIPDTDLELLRKYNSDYQSFTSSLSEPESHLSLVRPPQSNEIKNDYV